MDNNDDFESIRNLLRNFYKQEKNESEENFLKEFTEKINALFHIEMFSEKTHENNQALTDEERYYLGIDEYIKNTISAMKHKKITEHLLSCKICMENYNKILNKKKVLIS